MTTSSRLRGNVNPIFTMEPDGGTATSYADDLKKWEFEPTAKDDNDLTFKEAQDGTGVNWTLKFTCLVSFDTASLWTFLFDNAGSEVLVVFGPKGNDVPSATSPHFTGPATITLPPGFSNEARTSKEGSEVEVEVAFSDMEKVTTA